MRALARVWGRCASLYTRTSRAYVATPDIASSPALTMGLAGKRTRQKAQTQALQTEAQHAEAPPATLSPADPPTPPPKQRRRASSKPAAATAQVVTAASLLAQSQTAIIHSTAGAMMLAETQAAITTITDSPAEGVLAQTQATVITETSTAGVATMELIPDCNAPLLNLGPMIAGTLIKRPSAIIKTPYVADVQLLQSADSTAEAPIVQAHAPSMDCAGIMMAGARVFMTSNVKEDGTCGTKTSHTIWFVEDARSGFSGMVGCHPNLAERVTKEAALRGLLADMLGSHVRMESQRTFGGTRVDFVLHHADGSRTLVEVKNVPGTTILEGTEPERIRGKPKVLTFATPPPTDGSPWAPTAVFPHGGLKPGIKVVSDRAIKHVHELTHLQQEVGADGIPTRCAVLFLVNRSDCTQFRPNDLADPLFANVVKHAQTQGVQVLAHDVFLDATTGDVHWGKRLPVVFNDAVTGEIDMEHLDRVLHFNKTDPSKNWKKAKAEKAAREAEEDEEDDETPKKAKAKAKAKTPKRKGKKEAVSEEEDEKEETPTKAKAKVKATAKTPKRKAKKDATSEDEDEETETDMCSSEEEVVKPPAKGKARVKKVTAKAVVQAKEEAQGSKRRNTKVLVASMVVEEEEGSEIATSEEVMPTPKQRGARGRGSGAAAAVDSVAAKAMR